MYEFHNCSINCRRLVVGVSADANLIILTTQLLPYDLQQVLSDFAVRPQLLVFLVKFALEQVTKAQRGVEVCLYSFFNLGAR